MEKITWHIEDRRVADLVPHTKNPRKWKKGGEAQLDDSVNKFGLIDGLFVCNADGTLIDGHGRIEREMAKGNGERVVKVNLPSRMLTEAEVAELLVRLGVHGRSWDFDLLKTDFFDGVDFEGLGMEGADFRKIKAAKKLEAGDDGYEVPSLTTLKTDIISGDLIEFKTRKLTHKLLCGDSTHIETWEKLMSGKKGDLVVSDPPYNVDYQGGGQAALKIMNDKQPPPAFFQFLLDFYTALFCFLKPGAACYIWHAESESVNFRKAFQESGFLFKQVIIWVKNQLVMGRQDYQWRHEPCIYGWKPGAAHYFTPIRNNTTVIEDDQVDFSKMKKQELVDYCKSQQKNTPKSTVIRYDKPQRNTEHPTMKPVPMIGELIENSSLENALVMDGFLGSGTTMVASHQLERNCYGMELDPKYCQVIVDRMRKLDTEIDVYRNGELLTFEETQ